VYGNGGHFGLKAVLLDIMFNIDHSMMLLHQSLVQWDRAIWRKRRR